MDHTQAVENSRSPQRSVALRWVGWVNAFVAAAASAIYVAAKCHLAWPAPADSAISIAGAIVLWIITAIVAIVLLGVEWRQIRQWSWSVVAVPVLVACAIGIGAVGQPRFEQSRPEFEAVAQQLLQEPDDPKTDGYHRDLRIGRFDVSHANVSSQGQVYFYDARNGLGYMNNPGWVYAPDGVSEEIVEDLQLESLGGPWYSFPNLVVND